VAVSGSGTRLAVRLSPGGDSPVEVDDGERLPERRRRLGDGAEPDEHRGVSGVGGDTDNGRRSANERP
jgi:hypothetical protein